jgi:hypothetical protein
MPRYLLRIFNNLYIEKIIPEKKITLIMSILNFLIIKIIEQPRRDIISRKIKNLFLVTIVNFWLQHFVSQQVTVKENLFYSLSFSI